MISYLTKVDLKNFITQICPNVCIKNRLNHKVESLNIKNLACTIRNLDFVNTGGSVGSFFWVKPRT